MIIQTIGKIPAQEELARITQQTKVMPYRICYEGKGGNTWKRLRQEDTYSTLAIGNRELIALQRSIRHISALVGSKPINLIHIGPGEGIEIPVLFQELRPNENAIYAGVDIAKEMLQNTERLQRDKLRGIPCLWYQTDIETPGNLEILAETVRKKGVQRNLVCLLGQGVISSNEQSWENIEDSLKPGDFFYLTIEGDSQRKRDEIRATYNLPFVKALTSIGLSRAGYKPDQGKFKCTFNSRKSRIELWYHEGKARVLCLTSYKPTSAGIRERLTRQGFNIEYINFYKDIHTFAVLCTKD